MKTYMRVSIILFVCMFSLFIRPAFSADSESDSDEYSEFLDELEEEEEEAGQVSVADPLYYWNKTMFHFNDKLYFWLLKPAATGYRAITPSPVRTCVKNFFTNLTTPVRFVNCLLQGKSDAAGVELGRFMVNTTFGVLGLGNPAEKEPKLKMPPDEDLGQTLGVYGIGNGFYIVWPILGPSTLRDSIGTFADGFLAPVSYVEPVSASGGIEAFDMLNSLSFRIGDYEALKESALEPYEAFRNAYIQYRTQKLKQ